MIHFMPRKAAGKPRTRSGPKADWKHVGADVPPETYEWFVAEAGRQGVPQSVVLRWALEDYRASMTAQGAST